MRSALAILLVALWATVAHADSSLVWSSISPTSETVTAQNGQALVSRFIPAGTSMTLEAGQALWSPEGALHVWLNQSDGVTPLGAPWVAWGTGSYVALPSFTIHGPLWVFLLYAGATGPVYYSILWTVRP